MVPVNCLRNLLHRPTLSFPLSFAHVPFNMRYFTTYLVVNGLPPQVGDWLPLMEISIERMNVIGHNETSSLPVQW